jgi:hypothetical protein
VIAAAAALAGAMALAFWALSGAPMHLAAP